MPGICDRRDQQIGQKDCAIWVRAIRKLAKAEQRPLIQRGCSAVYQKLLSALGYAAPGGSMCLIGKTVGFSVASLRGRTRRPVRSWVPNIRSES
jgi:hypothetical protein